MNINFYNPLDIIFWSKKRIIAFSFFILFSAINLSLIDTHVIGVPYLRLIFVLILLLFVPGFLICRLINIKVDNLGFFLISLGISILVLMILGVLINLVTITSKFGNAFTMGKIYVSYILLVSLLCGLIYVYFKDYSSKKYSKINIKITPSLIYLLSLLPFAYFGTYVFNCHNQNYVTLIFLLLLSFFPLISIRNEKISFYYPLGIFIVSISLLMHRALISNYLWGWDIFFEHAVINNIISTGYWDVSIFHHIFSMLSIVILGPVLSSSLGIESMWVLKAIYPIIFSFVPVGIYYIGTKLFNKNIALFSSILFISVHPFYLDMLQLARQQIAELFIVLFLVVLVSCNIKFHQKYILLTSFAFGIIVSHYGLSIIFLLLLPISIIFAYVLKLGGKIRLNQNLRRNRFNYISKKAKQYLVRINSCDTVICNYLFFIPIYAVFFCWYIYTSSGRFLYEISRMSSEISNAMFSEFISVENSEGFAISSEIITSQLSLSHEVTKYLNIIIVISIIIGMIYYIIWYVNNRNYKNDYLALSFASICILLATVIVPHFSAKLNFIRFYQICLIFLSPFAICGLYIFLGYIVQLLLKHNTHKLNFNKIIAIFFGVFILFNVGFIYTLINENPNSFSLNKEFPYPIYSDSDIEGINWVNYNLNGKLIFGSNDYQYLYSKSDFKTGYWHRKSDDFKNDLYYCGAYIRTRFGYPDKFLQIDDKSQLIYGSGGINAFLFKIY